MSHLALNMESDDELREEIEILRKELVKLTRTVKAQSEQIAAVGGRAVKQEPGVASSLMGKSPTKPRDVPILELAQLEGIEAAARLQMFIELVEQVSDCDEVRVKVAKSRLSPEIAMLVHNRQQRALITWSKLCHLLKTEFAVEVNVDRAWQDLDAEQYDWGEESPQAFSNRFICKYAVLETKFPAEHFPNQEKTIKRKIWRGLPRELKERTEGFLDEDYPLGKFMERVDYQRQLWLDGQAPGVHTIQQEDTKPNGKNTGMEERDQELVELRQQVATLTRSLSQLQTREKPPGSHPTAPQYQSVKPRPMERRWFPSQPPQYCTYCRTGSHSLKQCWKALGPRRCFDCNRENCRRGNPDCPKRVNRQL